MKVLEAQGRPGGRVLTLRTFDDGLYADAGEHCSVQASWMNGALESGRRAARAVNEAAAREAQV